MYTFLFSGVMAIHLVSEGYRMDTCLPPDTFESFQPNTKKSSQIPYPLLPFICSIRFLALDPRRGWFVAWRVIGQGTEIFHFWEGASHFILYERMAIDGKTKVRGSRLQCIFGNGADIWCIGCSYWWQEAGSSRASEIDFWPINWKRAWFPKPSVIARCIFAVQRWIMGLT